MGFPSASAGNAGLIPGSGRCPREENSNPLQEIPGNPMYSLASYIVHGLARVRHDLTTKKESANGYALKFSCHNDFNIFTVIGHLINIIHSVNIFFLLKTNETYVKHLYFT